MKKYNFKPGQVILWKNNDGKWVPVHFRRLYSISIGALSGSGSGMMPWIQEFENDPNGGWTGWEYVKPMEYTVNKLGNFPKREATNV